MEVRDGVDVDDAYLVVRTPDTRPREKMPALSRARPGNRTLVVLGLIGSDVVLALVLWQVAAMIQVVWGSGALTTVAIAGMVPNIVVWVGLRFLLGLYPGYGLGQVEELRRQTFALFTTLAITTVFAFASNTAESLSRILLFAWILGLLLTAPLARYCAKLALKKPGCGASRLWYWVLKMPGPMCLRYYSGSGKLDINQSASSTIGWPREGVL